MKMESPKQQNSVDCSKDMIIKTCNILFHTLERNQVEENKSMLNNAMESEKRQKASNKQKKKAQFKP